MISIKWKNNLDDTIGSIPNHKIIKSIFSSILQLTIINDWKGACHESCAAIHILLNECGIENTWCIGEAKVGEIFFDHSWIEIDSNVYDIAICNPLNPAVTKGPVIRNIDINSNSETTVIYGVISGQPDDPMTTAVKTLPLTEFLENSPIHPLLGTWYLIKITAKND